MVPNSGGSGTANRVGGRKRQATAAGLLPEADDETTSTSVIGLNVGGRMFYTNLSTLTSGSAYFAVRFGGSFNAEKVQTDENGWDVYFVDANPELFDYVLDFLRRGIVCWPKKREDPVLHRRLIGEAEYFGIDSMAKVLTSIVLAPNDDGKGVMYWLGTNKGTEEYRNPYQRGAVRFDGTCLSKWDNTTREKLTVDAYKEFVGHRPLLRGIPCLEIDEDEEEYEDWFRCGDHLSLLWCDHSKDKDDLAMSFENVAVKPSHYSLRYSACYGMSHWDFQGSMDGKSWVTLHKARGDMSIRSPSKEKVAEMRQNFISKCDGVSCESERRSIATAVVEENLRNTWTVSAPQFFRHFRFVGGGGDEKEAECMHGVGFELYGEVEDDDA